MEYHLLSKSAELILLLQAMYYLHKTCKISKVVMGQRCVCVQWGVEVERWVLVASCLRLLFSHMLMLLDF